MRIIKAILLLSLFAGFHLHGNAQFIQVNVFLNDGSEQTYHLTEADRLYFEDNTKLVIEEVATKSTTTIPLADIRKITCEEYVDTEENLTSDVCIFPNPVNDILVLRNLSRTQTISIYALDGRLVKSFEATEGQTVSVSELPMGLYLVKTQSCTLKMIKL